ncbi:protein kinase domain-containing protein [Mycobacterium sp. MMS18-G62]
MPLEADHKFADYTVVRRLGAGGMGEVYLAQHPRLPRRDALKLLASDVSADPTFRERFLREADLASTLWHPHIVGVHDRGEYDGQLWISMDYVEGEDAASLITRRYPVGMPQELVSAIVTAVAEALDYAHKKGLLHRDVKPANILLTHSEDEGQQRILLTDFGIARTVDDVSGLTATNTTLGTVAYTAPEQLMGEDIDSRADQYSLAATAYHLLTGAPLFEGSSPAVVISRHLNTEPPALADKRPELAALDPVLAAGLAKDPNDRFASCSDFARAFAAQASQTAASMPAAPTTPAPVKRPPPKPPGSGKVKAAPASPLSPGWYPDPSGTPGTLYWDGQGWRTAPLPTPAKPKPAVNGRSPLLWVLGVFAVVLLFAVVWVFALGRDNGQSPVPSTSAATPTPALSPTPQTVTVPAPVPPQTVTVSAPPPPTFGTSTVSVPPVPVPVPQQVPYWNAFIVGTCDEGGSCGVQQRTGPYNEAPRKYSNDLKDGMTVSVVCQTIGDLRSSQGHGSSYVWYELLDGAYINSVYTNLTAPPGMPKC